MLAQGLVAYATSGDDASSQHGETSEDSYFVGSDAESDDSATKRRKEAESRLKDADEARNGAAASQILPDPLSVLHCQSRAPAYLTPEATRPLAAPVHRGGRSAPAPEQRQATPL
ncbi:hypothetical protein CVIRNUC_006575 [Coccomyxa viridis]|uniref:Uncharacterized protein n=1 Tax=Coccomyxa viridis TaxID=1274662 RepID=A0AAV1I7P6_9CHLO|nr:hypothetical protein CVIRNUC_006575 [Coccomyxa viridis]